MTKNVQQNLILSIVLITALGSFIAINNHSLEITWGPGASGGSDTMALTIGVNKVQADQAGKAAPATAAANKETGTADDASSDSRQSAEDDETNYYVFELGEYQIGPDIKPGGYLFAAGYSSDEQAAQAGAEMTATITPELGYPRTYRLNASNPDAMRHLTLKEGERLVVESTDAGAAFSLERPEE